MNVEQRLKSYNAYKAEIKDLELQIEELRDSLKAIDMSKDVVKTYQHTSETEMYGINAAEKVPLLESRKKHLEYLVNRIDNVLNSLSEEERIVIQNSVIEGKYYRQFAKSVGMSISKCKNRKRTGMQEIERVLGAK